MRGALVLALSGKSRNPAAAALIEVRTRLRNISTGLATLAGALEGAVRAINAQFDVILSALPGIGAKAAVVAERRPR